MQGPRRTEKSMDVEDADRRSPLDYISDPERADEAITPRLSHWIAGLGGASPSLGGRLINRPFKALAWFLRPVGWILRLPLLFFIQIYKRVLSPILPPACRFEPSCSVYTYQALKRHGLFKGSLLGVFRLLRCQPFCIDGYDPVPEPSRKALSG
jgi:uncharacterized protein